jgi:hypothetical protein
MMLWISPRKALYIYTPARAVYKGDAIVGENLRERIAKILEPPNISVVLTFCCMNVVLFINTL